MKCESDNIRLTIFTGNIMFNWFLWVEGTEDSGVPRNIGVVFPSVASEKMPLLLPSAAEERGLLRLRGCAK